MEDLDKNIEEIEREIYIKKAELEKLKAAKKELNKPYRNLESFTDEDKIDIFDIAYGELLGELEWRKSDDYHEDNDNQHYTWVLLMTLFLAKSADKKDKDAFWDYYNEED